MLSALCHLISPILLWAHVQVFEAGAVISNGQSTLLILSLVFSSLTINISFFSVLITNNQYLLFQNSVSPAREHPPTSCLMLCYDGLRIFRSNSYHYLDNQNEETSVSDVGSAPKTSVHDIPSCPR